MSMFHSAILMGMAMLLLSCVFFVSAQTTNTTTDPNATTTSDPGATTTGGGAASTVVTTSSPITTLSPTTAVNNDMIADGLRNVTCPFSRWQGDIRYCYECRWCPFRKETCCEMEDEISVLKSVNVSGSTDWDCFITIVHFQQCGRCDPRSRDYIMNKTLPYVWDPRGVSIRPCKQACRYIYKQCKDAKTLTGDNVVPAGQNEDAFCSDYPEHNSPEHPCFDSAGKVGIFAALLVAILVAFLL